MAWFAIVVPLVPVLTSAWIVMVTLPPPAMAPFHVTVFVPAFATAVPLLAVALTSVSDAGSTSVNSLPGLSVCAMLPEFVRTIV